MSEKRPKVILPIEPETPNSNGTKGSCMVLKQNERKVRAFLQPLLYGIGTLNINVENRLACLIGAKLR